MTTAEQTLAYQEQQRRNAAFSQIGSHGLSRWGGEVMDEFLVQLRGSQGRKAYREMADNCPITGALLQAIEMAIRAVDWRVEPGSEGKEDRDAAEFVQSNLDDMSFTWQDTLSDILEFLTYGWAYSECVYKRRDGMKSRYNDGRVGWRKFVSIAQETLSRWDFEDDGGIKGLWQRPPDGGPEIYLPIEKCLLFRTTAKKNNPEGRSVLRNAFTTYYYRKNTMEMLGIGMERDLTGLPVIIGPEGTDLFDSNNATLLANLKKIARDLKVDEQAGVVLNYGFGFQLTASPGSPKHNMVEVLNYLDRRIALTALAQFILLGLDKVGSFALSQSQSDLFTLSLSGWVDSIKQVYNLHAIPRLLRMNGMQLDQPPTLERGSIGSPDLAVIAEYVEKLAGVAAVNVDEEIEQYLRKVANLPEMPELGKGEPPRVTQQRDRLAQQRKELLSEEQLLKEIGYDDEATARILEQKRQAKFANTNIGEALLRNFERGSLTGEE